MLATFGFEVKGKFKEDSDSFERMKHLLLRMAYTAEQGYADYLVSENTFGNTMPLTMSRLTQRILRSIDMASVKRKRRENFLALATRLDGINRYRWELDGASVPLCYPLVLGKNVERLKKVLAGRGIYIPTYWKEVNHREQSGAVEKLLIGCCLALPCDQRYSPAEMARLVDAVMAEMAEVE